MRRNKGFTLVEIMIVILIIALLLAIAAPQWYTIRTRAQTQSCHENQDKIDRAKEIWIQTAGQPGSAEPAWADLAPDHLKAQPTCPGGGEYTIGDGTTPVVCNVHPRS